MTEDKKKLMNQYAITSEQRTVYHFKDFKYDNFSDALVYARIESDRIGGMNTSNTSTKN